MVSTFAMDGMLTVLAFACAVACACNDCNAEQIIKGNMHTFLFSRE